MRNQKKLLTEPDKLIRIAEKWGTPTYVYDEQVIRDRCGTLRSLFPDLPVSWLYAVKANDNPHILNIIREEGFGFDTVSYEEVLLCKKIGAKSRDIFYTENNMTDSEMAGAVRDGVVLNIGSLGRLESYCRSYPKTECSIRIKPDISDGHHSKVDTGNEDSKFGIRMDLLPEAQSIAKSHSVKISGIHAHIGSGIQKPENLLAEIDTLLEASGHLDDISFINFGGGMPIPYRPPDEDFDLLHFRDLAGKRLAGYLKNKNGAIRFFFEPGRWVVGPAGLLLTQVNTVKDQGRKVFLGTDTGFNHLLRPALYDAYHEVANISRITEPGKTYDVAGNICESGDILAVDRTLPETKTGDFLAILDAGAYGMTMASHYNRRALPAEILIRRDGGSKIVRKRLTAEQTIEAFLKDTRYQPKESS